VTIIDDNIKKYTARGNFDTPVKVAG